MKLLIFNLLLFSVGVFAETINTNPCDCPKGYACKASWRHGYVCVDSTGYRDKYKNKDDKPTESDCRKIGEYLCRTAWGNLRYCSTNNLCW